MADNNKTFYEVLGVPRNAEIADINRAYNRLRAEAQRETTAPNPRFAAVAKVAYETLSHADRRAQYDATLGHSVLPNRAAKRRGGMGIFVSVMALVAIAGAGYYYFAR